MRLSPDSCSGGGAARILQLGQPQPDHLQQPQQLRPNNQPRQQANSDNGIFPLVHPKLEGLVDSGLFPGVRPITGLAFPSKEYLWQVGTSQCCGAASIFSAALGRLSNF
jgi:hypothetical protein